jgi:type II secretory pathway pseudopilin PulG
MKVAKKEKGFSLIELTIAMTVTLGVLGITMSLFAGALKTRSRESSKTDALTSAQAALNVISREVANSGYGLSSNGIVAADSSDKRIRVRANLTNDDSSTDSVGEDVTYFYDATNKSIVRFDPNDSPNTSVVVNRISDIDFVYFDYAKGVSTPTQSTTASNNTGRVRITVTVELEDIAGQPKNQKVKFASDVTIRNSEYMLDQY